MLHQALALAATHAAHHAHKTHYHHPGNVVLAIAGLIGGLAVGVTGMGGGALMTPILVILLKIDPKVAIASDLLNSLVMKPIGSGVHVKRGTVHRPLVLRLVVGSVPAAFLGAYTLSQIGGKNAQNHVKTYLGWALIVACASLIAKSVLVARANRKGGAAVTAVADLQVKTVPTVLIGIAGGFIVGMTSVGSGSLMIVLLMLLYPGLSSKSLVGTDLVQAVPLVASAALGQYLFGHIDFGIAGALIIGSIPGVYVGARISAAAPDGIVRPILVFILAASALSLLFSNNTDGLGWALVISLVVGFALWGAVDAALRPAAAWREAGANRLQWTTVMSVGAPFGIGFLAAIPYFATVRRRLAAAEIPSATAPGAAKPRKSAARR